MGRAGERLSWGFCEGCHSLRAAGRTEAHGKLPLWPSNPEEPMGGGGEGYLWTEERKGDRHGSVR